MPNFYIKNIFKWHEWHQLHFLISVNIYH